MQLNDSFVLDGVRRTSDGYLAAFARVARTGVQVYKGSELGRPDLDTVRVYRPADEVFSADALRSFAHRPVTLRHPSVPVTSKNWKKFAGGQTGDEVVRDGDFVRVPMVMMDQALIDAYERDGIKELSMGYSTDIKWRAGVTDSGEPYDAVQTAIRGNHLAVVPLARGGDQLRIGDEDLEDDKDEHGYGSYPRGEHAPLKERNWDSTAKLKTKHSDTDPALHAKFRGHDMHITWNHVMGSGAMYVGHVDGKKQVEFKKKSEVISALIKHVKSLKDSLSLDGDTKTCPGCGASVPSDAETCPECGYEFDDEDTNVKDDINTGDYQMKLVIDGVPVNVADDQSGAIIERHIANLSQKLSDAAADLENFKKKKKDDEEQLEDAKKTISTKDGEIAVLKKQVEDAKVTPEKLDVMVKDRLAVIEKARPMLDKTYTFDGKSVEQVRKDAVTVKLGDAVVKHMNDAAIEGAFAALQVGGSGNGTGASQIGDALRRRPHTATSVADERTSAYDEMVKRQGSAWQTPAA